MGPKPLLLTIYLLLVGVMAPACTGEGGITPSPQQQDRETSTPATQETAVEKKAGETLGGKGELLIVAIKEGGVPARMVPNYMELKKGARVVFRFSGLDDQTHTFTATSLDLDLEVSAGATKESKPVTFNQNTTVFFFCRFHKGVGAVGSIKITN